MKKYFSLSFFIILLGIIFFLGKNLNPFDLRMFSFHDDTQAARISEFIFNLKSRMIPPRIAPHLSFGLGFPIFNYYAPFAYWFTSFLNLIGFSIPMALKLSFLLGIIAAFIGMFLFLKLFFNRIASLLGAAIYSGSTWFAVEIFIRGNLSEVWFIALFPIALFFLYQNMQKLSNTLLVLSIIFISFLLTSHNVLSLLSLLILSTYICFLPHKKRGFFILISALLLSSYFLIPALLESNFTFATEVAKKTNYQDHFLCIKQLWKAPTWEFGGSTKGCENDGMPFILGKLPILLSLAGVLVFLFDYIKKRGKILPIAIFVLLLTLISVFLTLYESSFIWSLLAPVLSLFQFPWRFLVFSMFGIGFFGAYLGNKINKRFSLILIPMIFFLLFTSGKYFSKPWLMSNNEFQLKFLSENYLYRTVAFNISEYLTKKADYSYWKNFDGSINPGKDLTIQVDMKKPVTLLTQSTYSILSNTPFNKEIKTEPDTQFALNIHYTPMWKIKINNMEIVPTIFDLLGRPILSLKQSSIVHFYYEQTSIEKISNLLTIFCFVFICILFFSKTIWSKLKPILK